MKRNVIIWGFILALFVSCSNENERDVTEKDVEVVSINDYINNSETRSSSLGDKVLRFKDRETYERILAQLRKNSKEDNMKYFKALKFEGAYSILNHADDELDSIFDIEDDRDFLTAYEQFKNKYGNIFVYNNYDKYDLSPYLPYSDTNLEIVGNKNGLVIIGDKVVKPYNTTPSYQSTTGLLDPIYDDLYGSQTLEIEKGKYFSKANLGYERNSLCFMIRFKSFKKKSLWTRRHTAAFYKADVIIGNNTFCADLNNTRKVDICYNIIPATLYPYENSRVGCGIHNFMASCCDEVKGSNDFIIEVGNIQ